MGCKPAVLVKYSRKIGEFDITGIYHEDLDEQAPAVSSFAIPSPPTRRTTLHVKRNLENLGLKLVVYGQVNQGLEKLSRLLMEKKVIIRYIEDKINSNDTWGGKMKVTFSAGPVSMVCPGSCYGISCRWWCRLYKNLYRLETER